MTPKQKYEELEQIAYDHLIDNIDRDSINGLIHTSTNIVSTICNHSLELIETFKDSVYYEHAKAFYEQVKAECK